MTPRRAHLLLAALALVAALEWISAAFAYRSTLSPAAWERAATEISGLDAPVLLGTAWLSPLARQHIPAFTTPTSLAPPDLHGLPRFHVLGHAGSPRQGAWSPELRDDLGELPPPILTGATDLGPLVLHHYEQPATAPVVADILAPPFQLRDDRGPCRLSSGTWTCKQGTAAFRLVEVAYRPRHCLVIQLEDGATLELTTTTTLGTSLRGHLGFADFNSRLRNDAPALLELHVDDAPAGRWTLTDNQGWAAFAAPTAPGRHTVRVRLTPLLSGSWTPEGYVPQPPRLACLELRALAEPTP